MLNDLLQRRVIFLLGKGGVGTTTVAAAIASAAAAGGARVLAFECDTRAPMAAIFGAHPEFEPAEVAERLYLMVLEGRHALEEYLGMVVPGHAVLRAVFASRLYQFFVQAAPGLKELMMLGKICYEAERKVGGKSFWDLIVVDAPASGQALSLLRMPTAALETFGESVVGRESRNIATLLRDPGAFASVLVTLPEPLSVSETIETATALQEIAIPPAALVLNRSRTAHFSARDVARLKEHVIAAGDPAEAEHLVHLARLDLDHVARVEQALGQLRSRIDAPIIQVSEQYGTAGAALMKRLAAELACASADRPAERSVGPARNVR